MRGIQHIENTRWRMLRITALLAIVTIAVVSSLTVLHVSAAPAAGNILSANHQLSTGQYLRSLNGQYTVYMQTDGNVVVYGNGCALWGSGTEGTGSNNYLAMQSDGNLVIYTSANKALWGSGAEGTGSNNYLTMQDDGNLVVYTSANKAVWASGTSRANRLCAPATMSAGQYLRSPNGQYTVYMQTDGNLVIYTSAGKATWGSGTEGTGSNNYLAMQSDGNLVIYTSANKALWGSGTNGTGSNSYLVMQDDGNLVVYTSANKAVWASNNAGSGSATMTNAESTAINWAKSNLNKKVDSGLCLTFVFAAYSAANINLRPWVNVSINNNTYPQDVWNHFTHGSTGTGTPPAGALVFFNATSGHDHTYSHVELSVGGGQMISTSDTVKKDSVHYETLAQHAASGAWNTYVGWWLPA